MTKQISILGIVTNIGIEKATVKAPISDDHSTGDNDKFYVDNKENSITEKGTHHMTMTLAIPHCTSQCSVN